jgi:MerR family transcriptional regulator, copper efflux regulator
MLRYIETGGLVVPRRSSSGYRLYDAPELRQLKRLRRLLERFGFQLADCRFALRLREEPDLQAALDSWLDRRDRGNDWQHWEQRKHERLLAGRQAA